MLIDIFVPTGEVRQAKDFEFMMIHGGWSYGPSNLSHPIGIRHQVEVPDYYYELIIYAREQKDNIAKAWGTVLNCIPLPRPKKVKKWQFIYVEDGICRFVSSHYTEEEVTKCYAKPISSFIKIDQSEIEVPDDRS